jgi:hypothetical protein
VTGESFNSRPKPIIHHGYARPFDSDRGGTGVGGRVDELNLSYSRIDGSVNADEALAYLEWTMEFRNDAFRPHEVRLQIALPTDAVVSRATLWIDGEPREAAFAGRDQVRQAYEGVVRQRRDPLLVTTLGPDRILVQAFPIPSRGGTIKFRLGMTVPLKLPALDQAQFLLPSIVERNFNIHEETSHAVWVEGQYPLVLNIDDADSQQIGPRHFRINQNISDAAFGPARLVIVSARNAGAPSVWSAFRVDQTIVQQVVEKRNVPRDAVLIVIDGSQKSLHYLDQIITALEQIPQGSLVGLAIATEHPIVLTPQAWSEARQELFLQTLRETEFIGGQDNGATLVSAIQSLEGYSNADLLWIHNPQPVSFKNSQALLEQTFDRVSRLPHMTFYALEPGPNKLFDDGKGADRISSLARIHTISEDLEGYFENAFIAKMTVQTERHPALPDNTMVQGSDHVTRLWAREQVFSMLQTMSSSKKSQSMRQSIIELAAHHQLVTPVSGAVVLENSQQYENNKLNPVEKNSVPTIPEPHQWLLAFTLMALMIWYMRRNPRLLATIAQSNSV